MVCVAILGASSQIAKDLICRLAIKENMTLLLYVRNAEPTRAWLAVRGFRIHVALYEEYGREPHDAVINFVGVGDPRRAHSVGGEIFSITQHFDDLVLTALRKHPERHYVFLSSGAAYCSGFAEPADVETRTSIALNAIEPQDYYAVAKFHAECRHRSLPDLSICDIRIFNYFSRTQDIEARFFITDALRAVRDGLVFKTSASPMVRDYLHPDDFAQLIGCVLSSPAANDALDCYSRAPVTKQEMLDAMTERFGLRYEVSGCATNSVNATGSKPNYYSKRYSAAKLGYKPTYSSLGTIFAEAPFLLKSRIGPVSGITTV